MGRVPGGHLVQPPFLPIINVLEERQVTGSVACFCLRTVANRELTPTSPHQSVPFLSLREWAVTVPGIEWLLQGWR